MGEASIVAPRIHVIHDLYDFIVALSQLWHQPVVQDLLCINVCLKTIMLTYGPKWYKGDSFYALTSGCYNQVYILSYEVSI